MLEKLVVHVKQEWAVLKKAPFSFVMLVALCLGLGFAGGMLYYASQVASLHEQIGAKDSQLGRYRIALGIDPASKGALVELNNEELRLKAQSTVAKLRELNSALRGKYEVIKKQLDEGKITAEQAEKDQEAAAKVVSESFDSNLASDALNVENEVRRRLDPKAIAHIVRVPAFIDSEGSRITVLGLMRGASPEGFSTLNTFFMGILADEIEQMAKLLPPDSAKK